MAKLQHKLHITGTLTVETGLHIGGSEVELDIGGIDSEVIKIKQGEDRIPYIPGSSLKGKLRTLLARTEGTTEPKKDTKNVLKLFGRSESYDKKERKEYKFEIARLIIRDSYPTEIKPKEAEQKEETDSPEKKPPKYKFEVEDKAENVIDRVNGGAKPRHLERVSRGSSFDLDMIMDVYDEQEEIALLKTLKKGFELLQKDYLGGSGTRGYGQVIIRGLKVEKFIFENNGKVTPSTPAYEGLDLVMHGEE